MLRAALVGFGSSGKTTLFQLMTSAREMTRAVHGKGETSVGISKVPDDPFATGPLHYHRLADGVVVYSVGPDGKDNGGVIDRENPTKAGTPRSIAAYA